MFQVQHRELPRLSDVRRACRFYARQNLIDRLPAVLHVLHDIDEENDGDRWTVWADRLKLHWLYGNFSEDTRRHQVSVLMCCNPRRWTEREQLTSSRLCRTRRCTTEMKRFSEELWTEVLDIREGFLKAVKDQLCSS